jgi:SEC-C motif domain protein
VVRLGSPRQNEAMALGSCPCGSGAPYAACCELLHDGAPATTAERLMRSRFSAFALGRAPYLLASWHPLTRPARLDLDSDVTWRRLQVVDTVAGGIADDAGVVEFRASFRSPDAAGLLHERSRFARVEGRWMYLDGDILE